MVTPRIESGTDADLTGKNLGISRSFDLTLVDRPEEFTDLKCEVLQGHPVNREIELNRSRDGKIVQATWECFPKDKGPYAFRFVFTEPESILFLKGEVTIAIDGGEPRTYRAGESLIIEKGATTIFSGNTYVKKHLTTVSE